MELANHFLLESSPKYIEESKRPKISVLLCTGQQTRGCRPNTAHYPFVCSRKLRRVFTFLSGFKNQKNSIFWHMKILLNSNFSAHKKSFMEYTHTHAHSLCFICGRFHTTNGSIELLQQRLYGPRSLKYLLSGLLQKKFAKHGFIGGFAICTDKRKLGATRSSEKLNVSERKCRTFSSVKWTTMLIEQCSRDLSSPQSRTWE